MKLEDLWHLGLARSRIILSNKAQESQLMSVVRPGCLYSPVASETRSHRVVFGGRHGACALESARIHCACVHKHGRSVGAHICRRRVCISGDIGWAHLGSRLCEACEGRKGSPAGGQRLAVVYVGTVHVVRCKVSVARRRLYVARVCVRWDTTRKTAGSCCSLSAR